MPDGLRDGAALVLIYPHAAVITEEQPALVPHVLLTVRGSNLRKHTGQVSFPGGCGRSRRIVRDGGAARGERRSRRRARQRSACSDVSRRCIFRSAASCSIPLSALSTSGPTFRFAEWEVARLLEVPLARLDRSRPRQARDAHARTRRPVVSVELSLLRSRRRKSLGRHGDGARRVPGDGWGLTLPAP